ncbi:MAG: PH domain-containing protein [Acidimicrobiales bacterium]|nr:PH domain-containing protein [Acidimicrobiales bacterium]
MEPDAPRRLHPISPLFELIGAARQLLLPVGAAAVAGRWWFAAPAVVVLLGRCLTWFRFTYQVDGDVIRINEGLITRTQRTIALDRVQQIDVVEKLLHRLLGVVGLHVDTASGARGAELELEVVSLQEAERLRALIARAAPSATVTDEAEPEATAAVPATEVLSLGVKELAIAGMTGAQTIVILGAVLSLQEVLDFVNVDRLLRLVPEGAESSPLAIGSAVLTLAAVWLGLAAAAMVLTHFEYTLTTTGDQFRVTRGLLDRREVGGALARVQAVRVEQTLLRRFLGFAAVRVQTAAVPGQSVSRILIPYVRDNDVERVVNALVPDTAPWPELEPAPQAARTLAIVRRVPAYVVAGAVVAAAFWPWGLIALVAIPGAYGAALLHWHALGYAHARNLMWARRGGLFRETVIVPAAKAQSMRVGHSPLQRRYGLASLRIDVAGRGGTPRLQDAPRITLGRIVKAVPAAAVGDERVTRAAKAG